MNIKHFIDKNGKYLGNFIDGALPNIEHIEVPERPDQYHTWDGTKWVEDTAAKEAAELERIRSQRDQKLSATDWAVLPDSPHDTQAVRDYRQALRDITKAKSPDKVKWPDNPLEK